MIIKNAPKLVLKKLEFTATAVTKDASGDCIIEGYANTSTKDRVGDVVMPEAFRKSLATFLKNPVLLANHDWNDPCGKILSAEITDKGLYVKARISDTRPDIKTLINEGCLSTFSIGYNEIDADFDESTKTKYVKELELLEISVVTVPANIEASFTVASQKDESADAAKTEEDKKSAPVRTAKELKDFIDTVKAAVGKELTGNQIIAVCEYFNNPQEDIMTRKQLIDLLSGKKDASAPAPAAAPAETAKADAPADQGDKAPADDAMKQILAKLDAIGQALAQILDASKADAQEDKPEDKPADDAKADEKPADDKDDEEEEEKAKDKPADDEEEMSDEDCEKAIADLTSEIAALEDAENA